MNFARNKICFKCEEPRPKRQLNPGEWECPSCDYVNFRHNRICKKCSQDRPEDDTQGNQMALRNTRGAGKSKSFDFSDQDSDNDGDASPYKGFRKHVAGMRPKPDQRTSAKREALLIWMMVSALPSLEASNEDEDKDISSYEAPACVSRRATLSRKRFTAA